MVRMWNPVTLNSPQPVFALRYAQLSATVGVGCASKWATLDLATQTLRVEVRCFWFPRVRFPPCVAHTKLCLGRSFHTSHCRFPAHFTDDYIPQGRRLLALGLGCTLPRWNITVEI